MRTTLLAMLCASAFMPNAAQAASDCFTIYDATDTVVLRSTATPVDLSKPISQSMREKFPGHHLVWTRNDFDCPALDNKTPGSGPLQGIPLAAAAERMAAAVPQSKPSDRNMLAQAAPQR